MTLSFFPKHTLGLCFAICILLLHIDQYAAAFSQPNSFLISRNEVSYHETSSSGIATKKPTSLASTKEDCHKQPTTRRSWLTFTTTTTAALALPSSPANADKGAATSMAPPALVPSPIRPSGDMAKTCEVVALGREDICLVPLKLPSAYDRILIDKAVDKLGVGGDNGDNVGGNGGGDGKKVKVATLLRSLSVSDWEGFDKMLVQPLEDDLPKGTVKSLRSLGKKKDAPAAIQAVLKIAAKL